MAAIGIHPSSIAYRLRQTARALRSDIPEEAESIVSSLLSPAQIAAFRNLPRADQVHSIRVVETLRRQGAPSHDLLVAGLLHDIAKVQPTGRVRFPDRVARVILAKFAPRMLTRLAGLPAPRWRIGLALAVHHPALGARQAEALGCTPRTCWLIEHHADRPLLEDPELRLLVAADHHAG